MLLLRTYSTYSDKVEDDPRRKDRCVFGCNEALFLAASADFISRRFDAALRPPMFRRFSWRRRRHASGQTLLFSSSSQFLGQGLFAAPRQHARVLDGSFLLLCLRLLPNQQYL